MSYGGTPTLGVAVRRMPMVRKPAADATVTSSGGVVSSTVRWASESRRDGRPGASFTLVTVAAQSAIA
jgi:hypothetical protein